MSKCSRTSLLSFHGIMVSLVCRLFVNLCLHVLSSSEPKSSLVVENLLLSINRKSDYCFISEVEMCPTSSTAAIVSSLLTSIHSTPSESQYSGSSSATSLFSTNSFIANKVTTPAVQPLSTSSVQPLQLSNSSSTTVSSSYLTGDNTGTFTHCAGE